MDYIKVLGLLAGFCTTLAFVPQVVKIWRSRSAKDISLGMFVIFILGLTLWLIYGILINDLPMILANGITLLLAGCILYFKLTFDREAK